MSVKLATVERAPATQEGFDTALKTVRASRELTAEVVSGLRTAPKDTLGQVIALTDRQRAGLSRWDETQLRETLTDPIAEALDKGYELVIKANPGGGQQQPQALSFSCTASTTTTTTTGPNGMTTTKRTIEVMFKLN